MFERQHRFYHFFKHVHPLLLPLPTSFTIQFFNVLAVRTHDQLLYVAGCLLIFPPAGEQKAAFILNIFSLWGLGIMADALFVGGSFVENELEF